MSGHKKDDGRADARHNETSGVTEGARTEFGISPQMIDAALNAWFKSPPSESDIGLERSMTAALTAAFALHQPERLRDTTIHECTEAVKRVGNFGDYKRDELTADFGQPRFDMMNSIIEALQALPQAQPGDAPSADGGDSLSTSSLPQSSSTSRIEELEAALRDMTSTFKPFRMKPVGAPGSAARLDQEEQIRVHAAALAILASEGLTP